MGKNGQIIPNLTKTLIPTLFNKNTPLVITGQAEAILQFEKRVRDAHVLRDLIALPSPVIHHSQYALNFKGQVIENNAPIVIVQNKEYCDTIVNLPDQDELGVINYNFKIVQLSYVDEILSAIVYTKEQYKELSKSNPTWDFRD